MKKKKFVLTKEELDLLGLKEDHHIKNVSNDVIEQFKIIPKSGTILLRRDLSYLNSPRMWVPMWVPVRTCRIKNDSLKRGKLTSVSFKELDCSLILSISFTTGIMSNNTISVYPYVVIVTREYKQFELSLDTLYKFFIFDL